MKVFIIGGCNTVVNALLQKFNKEGLKLDRKSTRLNSSH